MYHVRGLKKKGVDEESCTIETSSCISTSGSLKRRRQDFDELEKKLLWKHLAPYINSDKSIIKHVFEEFVSSMPELAPLVSKFGVFSLQTKVRTERLKRLRH